MDVRTSHAAGPAPRTAWRFAPLAAVAAGLALAFAFGLQDYLSLAYLAESRDALRAFVAGHLVLACLAFVAIYALAVALAFPAPTILTIVGGLLFGWWLGGILTIVAATAGASAIFLAARHAFGDVLRRRAGGAVKRFAEGFESDAFSYLLVLRLTPVLPFTALNIVPAFFDIRLKTFAAATFLGIVPGTLVYTFLGSGIDASLAAIDGGHDLAISDLVTAEMTLALFGLAGLSIFGLVLKKWFFGSPVLEKR